MNEKKNNKKGIKTIGEKGILFRSRIEARWAKMFTDLGFDWDYEPFDLNGYIPDFIIKLPNNHDIEILVEVKSTTNFEKLTCYKNKIINSGWKGHFLIVGSKIWNLDEIKKYKNSNIKKLLDKLDFFITQRTVIGLLYISTYVYIHKNKTYKDNDGLKLINNPEDFKENQELYIIKNKENDELIKIFNNKYKLNEYIYDKINSIKINEELNIEYNISLIEAKISIEWDDKLCFLGLDDIIDNIEKIKSCIEDKRNMIYFYFNEKEHNFKHEKMFWHTFVNNSYEKEYFSKIYEIWIKIQNEYQYKGK